MPSSSCSSPACPPPCPTTAKASPTTTSPAQSTPPRPDSPPGAATALRAERRLRRRLRRSFAELAALVLPPDQIPAAHHRLLIAALERVAAGTTRRLAIHLPPGSAKSTYASFLFPAFFLAANPEASIIAVSHTAALAEHFGRRLLSMLREHGPRLGTTLRRDSAAAHRFLTAEGGSYLATGVNGPIVGRRADLILIDDPIKSQAEADSPTLREQLWDWYRADLLSRLLPGGRVVLVMTRWHPDDLAGRLAEAGGFETITLPAIAEANDALGRPPGMPLWPDREDADALARRRADVGERSWAALYQQRPRLRRGGLFTIAGIPRLDRAALPLDGARVVRGWDLAATPAHRGGDPDWTAGVKLAWLPDGRFVVLDMVRVRDGAAAVEQLILDTARADGADVAVALPQDPGQAGRAQILQLTRRLAGFRVRAGTETGSKVQRAEPVAAQADAALLCVLDAGWTRPLLEELEAFPLGAKDDQVDALSRAFATLTRPPATARAAPKISLLAR